MNVKTKNKKCYTVRIELDGNYMTSPVVHEDEIHDDTIKIELKSEYVLESLIKHYGLKNLLCRCVDVHSGIERE